MVGAKSRNEKGEVYFLRVFFSGDSWETNYVHVTIIPLSSVFYTPGRRII
jgi:hypothetical protein